MTIVTNEAQMKLDQFVRFSMPPEWADLLGALFICGFNYSIESQTLDEDGATIEVRLTGYRVNMDGEQADARSVVSIWQYAGGEWEYVTEESGLHRTLKSGEIKIEPRTVDQLVNYIANRVNEWELRELDDSSDEVSEEVVDDGVTEEVVEEDVDDDLLDLLNKSKAEAEAKAEAKAEAAETPQLEAPKKGRSRGAAKSA